MIFFNIDIKIWYTVDMIFFNLDKLFLKIRYSLRFLLGYLGLAGLFVYLRILQLFKYIKKGVMIFLIKVKEFLNGLV